jgi:hypothetical protein
VADTSERTLRLEILREARGNYVAQSRTIHASQAERILLALKASECQAMIDELFEGKEPPDDEKAGS